MFCKRCYADLNQAAECRCLRCRRPFNPNEPTSYLLRPFPSRRKIIIHSLIIFILATIVSAVVAGLLSMAQNNYMNSRGM